jgi:hypothetical protein
MSYVPPDYSDPCYTLDSEFLAMLQTWRMQPDWARRRFMLGKPSMQNLAQDQARNKRFLYKYLPFDVDGVNAELEKKKVLDLLVEGQLYLSSIDQFNDPNEFRAYFSFSRDSARLRNWAKQGARQEASRRFPPGADREAEIVKMTEEILVRVRGNDRILQDAYESQLSQFGIYCLSRNPRSHLMWAHYSRSHRGICVQLDPTKCEGVLSGAQTVRYDSRLPQIEWPPEDKFDAIVGALTKSSEWDYEAELRYISRKISKNVIKFNARAVTGVITGLRFYENVIASQWLDNALAERRNVGLPELKMYGIVSADREYGLHVRKGTRSGSNA